MSNKKPYEPKCRSINLLQVFDELNLKFFNGMVCGGIGWKNIVLGEEQRTLAICYTEQRYIQVNTMLMDKRFPLWYVKFVIYHEMLHIYLGPQQFEVDGFSYPHNERFQMLEQKHPDYERAMKFEEKKLIKISDQWKVWREYKRDQKKKIP